MPGFKKTEVGAIPEDWEIGSVASKGEVVTGKALAVNGPGRQRPYLRTKNVFDGRIDIDDVLTMPMTDDQFEQFRLRDGDVLLNEGQSLELVGRCAVFQGEYPDPCAIQNQLIRFRAKKGISGLFASFVFRRCQQSGVFARIALQTTSIAHLGGSRFQQLLLAWPTSELEQRAIGEALSDADALIESLEQLIAKKRHLKQGAMQELLTGKWRLPGLASGHVGYKTTEVGVIPENWKISRLTSVADVRDGTHESPEYRRSGVPFVTSKNITAGTIDFQDITFISEEDADRVNKRSKVERGDILMSMIGTVGNTALVDFEPDFCIKNVALIKPRSFEVHPEFLIQLFRSTQFDRYIENKLYGGIQKFISLGMLRDLFIPLPSTKSEQTAIAAILSDMDGEIAALEAKLAKARDLKQGMMQNLLTGKIRLV